MILNVLNEFDEIMQNSESANSSNDQFAFKADPHWEANLPASDDESVEELAHFKKLLVIGDEDDRRGVGDSHKLPFRSLALLYRPTSGHPLVGTGTVIWADVILTAGHVVYDWGAGDFRKAWQIYQAINGPQSPVISAFGSEFSVHPMYQHECDPSYDFGLVFTNKKLILPPSHLAIRTAMSLVNSRILVCGYDGCNSPFSPDIRTDVGGISNIVGPMFRHHGDTRPGTSGGPCFQRINEKIQQIGIHVGDFRRAEREMAAGIKFNPCSAHTDEPNVGLRFTPGIMNWIEDEINQKSNFNLTKGISDV